MIITSPLRILLAKMGITYDNSSTQIQVPEPLASSIIEWGKKNIPDDVLHNDGDNSKGRENDVHCTLLYGLKTSNPDDVRKVLKDFDPFEVRLGLVTAFKDKDDYDVVKIDVESPDLLKMHYAIRESLKNDNDYPTYAAHCTIAYVKKGAADDVLGDATFRGKKFTISNVIFSTPDNDRIQIPIGG